MNPHFSNTAYLLARVDRAGRRLGPGRTKRRTAGADTRCADRGRRRGRLGSADVGAYAAGSHHGDRGPGKRTSPAGHRGRRWLGEVPDSWPLGHAHPLVRHAVDGVVSSSRSDGRSRDGRNAAASLVAPALRRRNETGAAPADRQRDCGRTRSDLARIGGRQGPSVRGESRGTGGPSPSGFRQGVLPAPPRSLLRHRRVLSPTEAAL